MVQSDFKPYDSYEPILFWTTNILRVSVAQFSIPKQILPAFYFLLLSIAHQYERMTHMYSKKWLMNGGSL